jgi:hypothetical protein
MMTGQALSDWILKYTRDDATLSTSKATDVMHCPMKIVLASLVSRKIKVPERATGAMGLRLRLQLRALLQLEQEYSRMTMHMRDTRFSSSHVSKGCTSGAPDLVRFALPHADTRESVNDVVPESMSA